MSIRLILSGLFLCYSISLMSKVIDEERKTSIDEKYKNEMEKTQSVKDAVVVEKALENDLEILRLSNTKNNFPDCSKYVAKPDANSCLISNHSPLEEPTTRTWIDLEKTVQIDNSDDAMKIFNKELHKDAFLATWNRREFFRKLYPDLKITKEEEEAKECGLKMAECSDNPDVSCVDHYVTDEMNSINKNTKTKELDKQRKQYLDEQVVRALISSASLWELKKWDSTSMTETEKKCDKEKGDDLKKCQKEIAERSKSLKDQHLKSLDSIQVESPLLFKRHRDWHKRFFGSASKAAGEFGLNTKVPYEESDFMRFIVQKVDPSETLRKKIVEMINDGTSTKENIEKLMKKPFSHLKTKLDNKGKNLGNEKVAYPSVSSFLDDKEFISDLDKKMKEEASDYMGILGASATVTCKKRNEWPPYLHHYPALVEKTLKRIDSKYKTELMKDQSNAGFCFMTEKYKMEDPKVSGLMVMGATGLGVGAAALAIPGIGAPTAAILGLSSLAIYSFKDAIFSDADLVEIYGNKYATGEKMAKVSDVAGKNNLLMALDGIFLPADLAPLAVKFSRKVGANQLMKRASKSGAIDYVNAEDIKLLRNLLEDMALKNTNAGKLIREQVNPFRKGSKENEELVLEVLKKLHDDMLEAKKGSGVSKKELIDDFEQKINACLARKEGKFPLSDIKPMR